MSKYITIFSLLSQVADVYFVGSFSLYFCVPLVCSGSNALGWNPIKKWCLSTLFYVILSLLTLDSSQIVLSAKVNLEIFHLNKWSFQCRKWLCRLWFWSFIYFRIYCVNQHLFTTIMVCKNVLLFLSKTSSDTWCFLVLAGSGLDLGLVSTEVLYHPACPERPRLALALYLGPRVTSFYTHQKPYCSQLPGPFPPCWRTWNRLLSMSMEDIIGSRPWV